MGLHFLANLFLIYFIQIPIQDSYYDLTRICQPTSLKAPDPDPAPENPNEAFPLLHPGSRSPGPWLMRLESGGVSGAGGPGVGGSGNMTEGSYGFSCGGT